VERKRGEEEKKQPSWSFNSGDGGGSWEGVGQLHRENAAGETLKKRGRARIIGIRLQRSGRE